MTRICITNIIEDNGAEWTVYHTAAAGDRAYWVLNTEGASDAVPDIVGFYAPSVLAAHQRLGVA